MILFIDIEYLSLSLYHLSDHLSLMIIGQVETFSYGLSIDMIGLQFGD